MTDKQQKVLSQMRPGEWYTPYSLGTNEGSLESLRKQKIVTRRRGAQWGLAPGSFSLNVRYEYKKLEAA